LRNAPDLQVIPKAMGEVAEIREAFQIANLAGLSPEELDIYERKMMFIHDQRNAILKAERLGEARGEARMAREIARRLLGQFNDQQIADITGLPLTEVAALRTEG
jgi:hypothetical protein